MTTAISLLNQWAGAVRQIYASSLSAKPDVNLELVQAFIPWKVTLYKDGGRPETLQVVSSKEG